MPRLTIEEKTGRLNKSSKRGKTKRDTTSRKKRSENGAESRKAKKKKRSFRALTAGSVSGSLYDRLFYTDGELSVNLNTGHQEVDREVWETLRQSLPKGYTIPDPDFFHLIKTNIGLPRV